MYKIPSELIAGWVKINRSQVPSSADIICPFCHRKITFTLNSWSQNSQTEIFFTKSKCPACKEYAYFFHFDFFEIEETKDGNLFIYPIPKIRFPMIGTDNAKQFSTKLNRTYHSALNVYNSAEWSATAVVCRKLLEGILKTLLPEEHHYKSLYKQLESLPASIDLTKPILMLADAIRKAGNLGAHFDLEREPDEKIASLMMDLIEYLVEYIFVLPTRIEELHNSIDKLENTSPL